MKYLVSLTLLSIFLHASTTEVNQRDVLLYEKAKKAFYDADYEKSYQMFKRLFFDNLTHEEINYLLAKSAIELKNYGMASAAFERILINNPENHVIQFEIAKLFYLMGNENRAVKKLNELLELTLTEKLQNDVQNYLIFIKNNRDLLDIRMTVVLGTNYMSNANSAPNDKYELPNFDYLGLQGDTKTSDMNYIAFVNLEFLKTLSSYEHVKFENDFSYYNMNYSNEKEENFEFYSYKPGLWWIDSNHYYLGALLSRFQPEHNTSENYFDGLGIETKIYMKNHIFDMKAQRNFYRNDSTRDKNYTRYALRYRLLDYKNFDFSSLFYKDLPFKSSRTDINKMVLDNTLSYNYNITESLKLTPSFRYKLSNYKDESVAFGTRRKDRVSEYGLMLQSSLDNSSLLTLQLISTHSDSNHAEYDYNNSSVGLTYVKQFRW